MSLKGNTSAPIGAWEVKLEIMTESPTDQPTDRQGHRKVSKKVLQGTILVLSNIISVNCYYGRTGGGRKNKTNNNNF